ncbi:MAG: hypothetical protein QOD39_5552 [Mycobacterium sp.]|nr:hypothetical protein [Mycobacterium sp.]
MNALLWTLQAVLAIAFAGAGAFKLLRPRAELIEKLGGWVEEFPTPLIKPLGLIEVLAAVGLILPPLLHLWVVLTPTAAAGLVLIMLGAIATHARRAEWANVAVNVVLAAMAVVVAWGRFGPHSF